MVTKEEDGGKIRSLGLRHMHYYIKEIANKESTV